MKEEEFHIEKITTFIPQSKLTITNIVDLQIILLEVIKYV